MGAGPSLYSSLTLPSGSEFLHISQQGAHSAMSSLGPQLPKTDISTDTEQTPRALVPAPSPCDLIVGLQILHEIFDLWEGSTRAKQQALPAGLRCSARGRSSNSRLVARSATSSFSPKMPIRRQMAIAVPLLGSQ